MSAISASGPAATEEPSRRTRLLLFAAVALGAGAVAGVAWWGLVDLPAYRIGEKGSATTSERGLAAVIGGDAWFVLVGAVVGLGLGIAGWRLFGRDGWPVVALVAVLGLLAGLVCWTVGHQLGPGEFHPRLAAARPGDTVPVELTVRAWASFVAWPLFAVVPVLLGASLGRDDEEPTARPARSRRPTRARHSDQMPGAAGG